MTPNNLEIECVRNMANAIAELAGLTDQDTSKLNSVLCTAYAKYRNQEDCKASLNLNRIDRPVDGGRGAASLMVTFEDVRPNDAQQTQVEMALAQCMDRICKIMGEDQSSE